MVPAFRLMWSILRVALQVVLCFDDAMSDRDIWDSIRQARDNAKAAEQQELQRVEDADNEETQRSASVRVAARQAVREALDDILGDA